MIYFWIYWVIVMFFLLSACDKDAQEADRRLDEYVRRYGD
jgi:hypothetical protein